MITGMLIFMLLCMISCRQQNSEKSNSTTATQNDTGQKVISIYCLGPDGSIISSYEDNLMVQKLEEAQNFKFDIYHPDWSAASEDFEKMFRSGEYYNVLHMSNMITYKGGDDAGVEDGVFWELTGYIEKYMPNYYQLIHSDPEYLRLAYTDSGRAVGLLVFPFDALHQKVEPQTAVGGLIVRKDWLDESGMDMPVTYEDWEKVLILFRDKYGCKQPYYVPNTGIDMITSGFSGGYEAIPSMQKHGHTIEYGPMTDGWRDYLTMLHDWYEKGLIGSEYITNEAMGISEQACIDEETGAMICVYIKVDAIESAISPTADFCAVQYPVREHGQISQAGDQIRGMGRAKLYVTSSVSEDELPDILTHLDTLYSFENAFGLSYGEEGDTWAYNDQGEVEFTDKIMKNTFGLSEDKAMDYYLFPTNMMALKDWSRERISMSDENARMCEIWDRDGDDLYVPPVQLSAEEKELYDSIMVDVEPYMLEFANKVIVGAVDIDTGWDVYIQNLKSMHIDDAVKAYQDAYNRYLHR